MLDKSTAREKICVLYVPCKMECVEKEIQNIIIQFNIKALKDFIRSQANRLIIGINSFAINQ